MSLNILGPAQRDVVVARDWYNRQQSGLGERSSASAEVAMQQLLDYPTSWPVIDGDVHRCPVRSFPFDVLFFVAGNDVFIVAVMDQRRKPGDWKDRL
jgi:hypothetical protein